MSSHDTGREPTRDDSTGGLIGREQRRRRHLVGRVAVVMGTASLLYELFYLYYQIYAACVGMTVGLVVCATIYHQSRRDDGPAADVLGSWTAAAAYVVITAIILCMGGYRHIVVLWWSMPPAIGFALATVRSGVLWTAVCSLTAVVVYAGGIIGFDPPMMSEGVGRFYAGLVLVGYIVCSALMLMLREHFIYGGLKSDVLGEAIERNAELIVARDQARAADAAKSRFMSNMSHELRTPLHQILGLAQLARMADGEDERDSHLDELDRSGGHLLQLIERVLEYADADTRTPVPREFVVSSMLEKLLDSFEDVARSKGLELDCEAELGVSEVWYGDPDMISEALSHIVANAIAFTTSGRVAISLHAREAGTGLTIFVEDSGPGIDPDKQRHIFEHFSMSDESSTREQGGLGLGLAMAHRLVRALGGQIDIESRSGEGCRFIVQIPLDEPASSTAGGVIEVDHAA